MRGLLSRGCVLLVLFGLFCSLHLSFKSTSSQNEEVKRIILDYINNAEASIQDLHHLAQSFSKKEVPISTVRKAVTDTRLAYKKIEFILSYYFPEHTKAYINGAPLLHIDPYPLDSNLDKGYFPGGALAYINSRPLDYLEGGHYLGQPKVADPVGLQVLDELVYSDSIDSNTLIHLSRELLQKFNVLQKEMHRKRAINDFQVVEASRLQLVRIFTLGITGFDTPGSLNAIPESEGALQGMHQVLTPLINTCEDDLKREVHKIFKTACKYLKKNNDFEDFDRLEFLTEHINPLYDKLLDVHHALGLPFSMELDLREHAWNAKSESIFDEDFLNPYYYTVLKRSDNSAELRNLGKKLFNDKQLSNNGTMSCGSCHKPELAFSDGEAKSKASVEGKTVLRNAPGLINAVFADRFFYDLRAFDLQDQASHVVENHLEFNSSFQEILQKLNKQKEYQELFATIYGSENPISRHQLSSALTSYVMSLVSFNSPFDKYVRGESNKIDKEVRKGFNLFMGKAACGTCHFAPTFSGLVPPLYHENETEVLGVLTHPDILEIDSDRGRVLNGVPQENFDIYNRSFKTVTVRNVERTAPYFHNGSYGTLEQVVDFYADGGGLGKGFEYELPNQTLPFDSLELSGKEKQALVSFLKSLSDKEGVERFQKEFEN